MLAQLRHAALPALTALLLRGNPIGDEGIEALCVALREARAMPALRLLDLAGSDGDSDRDVGWTLGTGGASAAGRATVACKNAPSEAQMLDGHGRHARPEDMYISDRGVTCLASTMASGCLASLTRLYLHAQPCISNVGFGSLQDALLSGACGKLLAIHLEGHDADVTAWSGLVRVLRARGIDSDVLPSIEEDIDPRVSLYSGVQVPTADPADEELES